MTESHDGQWVDPTATASFTAVNGHPEVVEPSPDPILRGLNPEEKAAVEALPEGSALLIVQRGPNAGSRFLLDREAVTAGRAPSSDIFLDDVTVSRKHAVFMRIPGGFQVRDVGSLNGTYINRERCDQAVLSTGDEVQIGKYRLTYHPCLRQASAQ